MPKYNLLRCISGKDNHLQLLRGIQNKYVCMQIREHVLCTRLAQIMKAHQIYGSVERGWRGGVGEKTWDLQRDLFGGFDYCRMSPAFMPLTLKTILFTQAGGVGHPGTIAMGWEPRQHALSVGMDIG